MTISESIAEVSAQPISGADVRTLGELNLLISRAAPAVTGARHAVLGEGRVGAAMAIVGEQPGQREDQQRRPFVGAAGKVLDRALAEAGIDRDDTYLTHAVKHFKAEDRGKRHQRPTAGEVRHYRWWLRLELELVRPRIVVALGPTAVLAITGDPRSIGEFRGPAELDGHKGYIALHPAHVLQQTGRDDRHRAFEALVADLRSAHSLSGARKG
jgi:uracil-DNA glycosylase family protein